MAKINRLIINQIHSTLNRGKSILLLGPRQVGKTTLLSELKLDANISLARPAIRQHYEKNIDSFTQEIEALATDLQKKPLVAVDEIQKVPELVDAVQDLTDRGIAQFILTGSSARKLRTQHDVNWLPGRVVYFRMDPLSLQELPSQAQDIESLLVYGSLPSIVLENNTSYKEQDLESYVVTYLEEEVRQEALVRKLSDFARFLQLAAAESGQIVNFNKISQDIGVAQTTIAGYYQILEDCLIAERIEPFQQHGAVRRRLIKSCKYVWFDLGVRRIAANEGIVPPEKHKGQLFEQFVGLELLRYSRLQSHKIKLYFWRDHEGREVDWVIQYLDKLIPIEVKWSSNPSLSDTRHLKTFLSDYGQSQGYIICRIPRARKLDDQITALPWQNLLKIFI